MSIKTKKGQHNLVLYVIEKETGAKAGFRLTETTHGSLDHPIENLQYLAQISLLVFQSGDRVLALDENSSQIITVCTVPQKTAAIA